MLKRYIVTVICSVYMLYYKITLIDTSSEMFHVEAFEFSAIKWLHFSCRSFYAYGCIMFYLFIFVLCLFAGVMSAVNWNRSLRKLHQFLKTMILL